MKARNIDSVGSGDTPLRPRTSGSIASGLGSQLFLVVLSCHLAVPAIQSANAQIVRGTLIDSPAQIVATATNAPPPQSASTNSPATNAPAVATPDEGRPAADFLEVGFDKLSGFEFDLGGQSPLHYPGSQIRRPPPGPPPEIPVTINALDGRNVAVTGFMLPLKLENGRVVEFILLKNQMSCCYGLSPRINEWVHARVVGNGVKVTMDRPVTARGKLHVGEFRRNTNSPPGIYQMDCVQVLDATQ
jgi:hypothetical protein